MFLFKKTMFALAAASLFIFAGCSSSDDLNVKVAEIDATIDGIPFTHKAVAKVSNETAESGQDSKISEIFSSDGTLIYSQDLATKEKLIVTYRGKTPKTYKTDVASSDEVVTKLLDYLVSENTGNLSANDFGSVDANVTYYDGKDYWFSTFCTITISGQSNGVALSLINGTFNCNVYKKGDKNQKKAVSGTIYNVIGI